MSITKHIQAYIEQLSPGEILTPSSLLQFGKRANIDQTLSRLVKKGSVNRISRGIFVKPQQNIYVGNVIPPPYKIAEAIAKITGSIIQVHGAEAARRFGFTTQVPTQPVFNTSGPSRHLKIGQLEITLKHISPRKLTHNESKVGLALTALRYLGNHQVNISTINTIKNHLKQNEFENLVAAKSEMPAWMADVFHKYEQESRHE
jgi:hypothetical protein